MDDTCHESPCINGCAGLGCRIKGNSTFLVGNSKDQTKETFRETCGSNRK